MTTITRFTKEQLIARINKQIDINATIIERLGDDSAAVSELAVKTATMDMKILDAAAASLTSPPVYQAQYGNDWRDVERAQYDDHAAHGSPVRIVYAAPPAPVVPDDENGQPAGFAKWANRNFATNPVGTMTLSYCEDAW
ncbi:TPA: hypothetical protein JD366_005311, partial [Citrobacter amalonaticus]|nr:hypothetical protein [Citrobacter amalonaticus]